MPRYVLVWLAATAALPLLQPPAMAQQQPPAPQQSQGLYGAVGVAAAFGSTLPVSSTPGSGIEDESFRATTVAAPRLALGYQFSGGWRSELEYLGIYASANNDLTITDCQKFGICGSISVPGNQVSSSLIQLSLLKDFPTGSRFIPYVGGGLGMAIDTVSTPQGAASGTNFAGQGRVGVGYQLTPSLTLDLGYRVIGIGGGGTLSFFPDRPVTRARVQQAIDLGLRFRF